MNRASATTQAEACRRFISHRRSESGIIPKGIAPLTEKGRDDQHIVCSRPAYRPAAHKLERRINGLCREGMKCPCKMLTRNRMAHPGSLPPFATGMARAMPTPPDRRGSFFTQTAHAARRAALKSLFGLRTFLPRAPCVACASPLSPQALKAYTKKPPLAGRFLSFLSVGFSVIAPTASQALAPPDRSGPEWCWHRFVNDCRPSESYAGARA